MEIVVCQENRINSVNVSVVVEYSWKITGWDMLRFVFSLFAAEAFSALRLILVLSPLIMLHLHGGNATSASPPAIYTDTHHTRTM